MAEPSREQRLEEAIAAYYQAAESGRPVDNKQFFAQYPDLRDELAAFLRDKNAFEVRAGMPAQFGETATLPPQHPGTHVPGSPRTIRYFGDYELLDEIARGGMGVVFRARQVSLNRIVAVKMILAGHLANAADVQRFRAEAEAAANLDHPNILPIYEVGEHEGQHYFSMKLIEGGNFSWVRSQEPAISIREQVEMLVKVARAVHFAHQRGIIHRDLKPANILIDSESTPYVTDFGLAKRVEGDSDLTQSGAIVGTPSYMAPEQARAEKQLSTAVDVYSLGAILYECLTGRPPFHGPTPLDTLIAVLEREPERPTNCDRDLATIALKCLEKEPAKRYESAAALADDLDRWLRNEPIQARPSNPGERIVKWVKRKPSQAALLAVVVCWYFNLRFEWNWIETALLATVVLIAVWHAVGLLGYALGRRATNPLDGFLDGAVLPGMFLAFAVMFWYPATLAERRALAEGILRSCLAAGLIIRWLWWRSQAGQLLMRLRPKRAARALLIFACVLVPLMIMWGARTFLNPPSDASDLAVRLIVLLTNMLSFIWLFFAFGNWSELRKCGHLGFYRFLKWQDIESYEWTGTESNALKFHYWVNNVRRATIADALMSPEQKDAVARILAEQLRPGASRR